MTTKAIIVVAIGGNGICPSEPGAEMSFTAQLIHTKRTIWNLKPLFDYFHVVITHGNGPQAGMVYEEMIPSTPFGVITLITTSQISSAITRAYEELILENNLQGLPPMEPVLCWVVVDSEDPGFGNPSKPVGPQLSEDEVAALVEAYPEHRFTDYGKGKRRLIASPQPQEILNLRDVQEVVEDGKVPVALGGGGIPTILDRLYRREIANGIIDKDLSSALLAGNLAAHTFLILTNERGVFTGYKTSSQRFHAHITASQAEKWLNEGEFPPGSMGPKIKGALQFLADKPDGSVVIGCVEEPVERLLQGGSGTTIVAG